MPHRRPYRPQTPRPPADITRADTCDTRRFVNLLTGIWATSVTVPCYWYGSPNGDGSGRGKTAFYQALAPNGAGGKPTLFSIQHSTFSIPNWTFTFSAKERDTETGLSYFGSRYYSSDLSVWLSVDPMAHKYPSLSPYVYCANNPVKLVDPNGEKFRLIGRKTNIAFRNYLLSYKGVNCENIYEAFSLAYSNSNVIMFKDPNITYKQFASNYHATTGEKLKNKEAKKLFKAIKSDVFIEVNLVTQETISADCLYDELSHEQITGTPAFKYNPQSGNPALDQLMVEVCSDEFNSVFNTSAANFETVDSKFFSNITGDKTILNSPKGMMMVNACGKSAKQAQETLIREVFDFYDKLK